MAVNKSDILHRTTTTEGRRGEADSWGWMRKKAKKKMKREKRMRGWNDLGDGRDDPEDQKRMKMIEGKREDDDRGGRG